MSLTSIRVRCRHVVDSLIWMERTLNDLTASVVDSDEPMRWWITADLGAERYSDIAHLAMARRPGRGSPKSARVTWMLHIEDTDEPRTIGQLTGVLKARRWGRSKLFFTSENDSLFKLLSPHLLHELPPLPPPHSAWLPPKHSGSSSPERSTGGDRVHDQPGVELAAGRTQMDPVAVEHISRREA